MIATSVENGTHPTLAFYGFGSIGLVVFIVIIGRWRDLGKPKETAESGYGMGMRDE